MSCCARHFYGRPNINFIVQHLSATNIYRATVIAQQLSRNKRGLDSASHTVLRMAEKFKEFENRPEVLAAAADPRHVSSVLNSYFGCDTADEKTRALLCTDEYVNHLMSIWFESGTALDGTYKKFESVVKELKAGTLTGPEWDSLEGKVAKVLLADQLSRNAFRGTLEAFDYEPFSLSLMSELTSPEQIKETLTLPAAYLYAMAWALAHSEKEENLAKALEFLDAAIQAYPDFTLLVNRNKVRCPCSASFELIVARRWLLFSTTMW